MIVASDFHFADPLYSTVGSEILISLPTVIVTISGVSKAVNRIDAIGAVEGSSNRATNCERALARPVSSPFHSGLAIHLLTKFDVDAVFFGLCDPGLGEPVSIVKIRAARGKLGLPIDRDEHF